MNRTINRPTVSELEAVAAVARTRSFRGAARELGVSASALSHSVSSLERRLGVRLFQRTTRNVVLTAEGEPFVGHVGQVLRGLDRAVDDIHERSGAPSGTLRIVSPRGPARTTVLPAVLELRARFPDVVVELVTDNHFVDLVAHGYDAGVRYAGLVPPDMIAIPCSADARIAVVAAPSYLEARPAPRTLAALASHECIRYRKNGEAVSQWELRSGEGNILVDVHGHLVLDDESFLLDAALAGAGLAYITLAAASPWLASGRLVRVLERHSPRFAPVQLFYPSRSHVRPALRAFIDIVKVRRRAREG